MSQVHAMGFASEKTNMQVPKFLDAYANSETGYLCIVMEYIDGVPLDVQLREYMQPFAMTLEQLITIYSCCCKCSPKVYCAASVGLRT